ncbi:hypothetical protein Pyn_37190 [Prunus yedoensis var. nudiflora]|uniref:Uncharacterized protein n=1 Tax=Prunus yedoensis var. nudiflora TaxID=2094558 RepID=A0A314UHE4_PRUYE|nr:hypothetical protein Pyn_37190 [Prunus yedoensis var. nudiflora]
MSANLGYCKGWFCLRASQACGAHTQPGQKGLLETGFSSWAPPCPNPRQSMELLAFCKGCHYSRES